MGFDQYYEPPDELSEQTWTCVRVIQSMIEETKAIDGYVQRLAIENDEEAQAVLAHAQKEEFLHFGMDLEFLLHQTPAWRTIMKNMLFKEGELAEKAEEFEPTA